MIQYQLKRYRWYNHLNKTNKHEAYIAIVIAWLFYFVGIVSKVEFGVIKWDLQNIFGLDNATIGFYSSLAYYIYALLQIPYGILIDKIETKKIISICSGICGCGVLLLGLSSIMHSINMVKMARILIGASVAPAFLCCCKISGEFFREKYSLMMAISTCIGCIGGLCATTCTEILVKKYGWQRVTFGIVLLCYVVSFLSYLFMPSKIQIEHGKKNGAPSINIRKNIVSIAKDPRMWLAAYYGCACYIPISALAELWIIPFAKLRYPDITYTTIASGLIMVGFGMGGLFTEFVAKKINSYKRAMNIASAFMIILFVTAVYCNTLSYTVFLVTLFFGAMCSGSNTLAFGIGYTFCKPGYAGLSGSFINTIVSLSGILQMLLGNILSSQRSIDGIDTIEMYQKTFVLVIILMFLAFVFSMIIPNVKPQREE